jgi:hypothetical protein
MRTGVLGGPLRHRAPPTGIASHVSASRAQVVWDNGCPSQQGTAPRASFARLLLTGPFDFPFVVLESREARLSGTSALFRMTWRIVEGAAM